MFKKISRKTSVSAEEVKKLLATYGDHNAQLAQLDLWLASGWKQKPGGGLIFQVPTLQVFTAEHPDGGPADTDGLTIDDILNAVDETLKIYTPAQVGAFFNNGVYLGTTAKMKLKAKNATSFVDMQNAYFLAASVKPELTTVWAALPSELREKHIREWFVNRGV